MIPCDGFVQTSERSSMGHPKDSCLKCGRTKAWHERFNTPATEIATAWLDSKGHKHRPYYDLVRHLLADFIKDQKNGLI